MVAGKVSLRLMQNRILAIRLNTRKNIPFVRISSTDIPISLSITAL